MVIVVPLNIGVFLEVDVGSLEAGDPGDDAEVSDREVGPRHVLLALEERVQ